MVEPTERSDRIELARRTVLKGAAGLGTAGLAGSAGVGTAGAVVNRGWGWGLDHTALGDAELAFEDDALVVSGVDDGESGVNVSLGESQGVTVDTTLDWEVPVESYREFRTRGVVDGEPGVDLGLLRSVRVDSPDGFGFEPTFENLGSESYTFEVYDEGELVGRQEGAVDPAYIPDREPRLDIVIKIIWTDAGPIVVIVVVGLLDPIIGPRMNEYVGDEIRLVPEDVEVVPDAVTDLDVVGAGREQFTIHGEAVHALGNPHRQRGNARLHPTDSGEALDVTNVGESGTHGVAVGTGGDPRADLTLRDFDLTEAEASATFDARGTLDGTPDALLGSASVTNVGGEFEVAADFTHLGTDAVRVEGFVDGEKTGETTGEAGVLGYVGGVDLVGWCGSDGDPWPPDDPEPPIGLHFKFGDGEPVPIPAEFADGTEFEADELRFSPLEPDAEVTAVSEFGLGAARVGDFAVVDEQVGPR